MKPYRKILLTFGAFLALASAAAQPPRSLFTEYSSMDGLAHNNIHDIFTDSRGFVWLCTWSGVSRFDGYHFKNYCTDPHNLPVRHNRFRSVDEDLRGDLWFRTYDDRLYRFDRLSETFHDVGDGMAQLSGQSYKAGNLLCLRHSHKVWVEYQGLGLAGYSCRPDGTIATDNRMGDARLGADIAFLTEDSNGSVWVVGDGDKISVIDTLGSVKSILKADSRITAVAETATLMSFASDRRIYRIDKNSLLPLTEALLDTDKITVLTAEGDMLYVGTLNGGLYTLAVTDSSPVAAKATGERPSRIRNLAVDSHGTVWITDTRAGITRYSPSKRDFRRFTQKRNTVNYYSDTTSMVVERGDRVWIKMNQVGFGYYDRERDSVEPFYNDPSKPDCRMTNGVATFEVDADNVLWLSTYYERGLQKIVLQMQSSDTFALDSANSGSYSDEVRALTIDRDGNTWIGTKDGNLYCYGRGRKLLRHIDKTDSGRTIGPIYTLKEDRDGNMWVGTKGDGAYRITFGEGGKARFRHFVHSDRNPNSISNDQIYCIDQDSEGRIWLATYGGAIDMLPSADSDSFLNTQNSFPFYPKALGGKARYVLVDTPERILVGTSEGLLVFNPSVSPEKVRFTVAQRSQVKSRSLEGNDIIHILKDSKGRIWISTYGGGLSLIVDYDLSGNPLFETFTVAEGLESNIVFASAEDSEGNIWLSTEKGISKFEPARKVFTNYTQYDGIKPTLYSEAAAMADSEGNILFGGVQNLHIFDPRRMPRTDYDYRLKFTLFEVQNAEAEIGGKGPLKSSVSECGNVVLPYNYLLFRIEFASLNFRIQNRVSYMYRLDGYDNDWTVSRDLNSVYYSKVPHGRYVFRVKAFVGNPQMAGPEISLPIRIVSPPWLSWWAYCIYAALAALILWAVLHTVLTMARLRTEARIEQETSEIKLKFFTNISHELRTPLTLIMGGIEDVQKHETLSERGEGSLNLSYKNSKRMLALISQLLDFRKIVKDKMELHVSRIDLVPLAESVLEDFRDLADERKIDLLLTVSRGSVAVWADKERIESLLYNLLSNAMKFTRDGGTVSLAVAQREGDGFVTLTVTDSGIGIPKEKLGAIFDRFSQYAAAVRSDVSGSGIGLALCKEIVELHHGEITVESKLGIGSKFIVKLPTGNSHFAMEQIDFGSLGPSADEGETPAASLRRTDVAPPEGAQKILLVDDNAEMRAFIYNNLIENYEVTEAADGAEALEKVLAEQPDIIITDLMMPRMDGIELVNRIRKNFETSHIPVIMLTAKQTPEDRIKAMKYGADGYITKPFSIELLSVRIDNLLSQRRRLFEKFSAGSAHNRAVDLHPKDVVVTNRDEEFLKELMAWIDSNLENSELTIDDLATHMKLGRTTMYNKIKSLTGKSPVELIKEYRVAKSELLLKTGQFSVSEVAYKVGFTDPGYFSRCFKEQYKLSPIEYLKKNNIKSA